MRSIISGLGIILAISIFYFYTRPTYDSIQATQGDIAQYNAALSKATELQQVKQKLLSQYNSFDPNDLDRLQKMLPDQVNNISLILDLDTLANKYGMSLENVEASAPDTSDAQTGAVASVGVSNQKYDSLTLKFTVHGTYANFEQFLGDLQSSLRIIDVDALTVTSGGSDSVSQAASSGSIYTYTVTVRTYWLK